MEIDEEFMRDMLELAQKNLENSGDLMPTVFIYSEGQMNIIGLAEGIPPNKEPLFRELAKRFPKAEVMYFLADAYVKNVEEQDFKEVKGDTLMDDPEAGDIIILTASTMVEVKAIAQRYEMIPQLEGDEFVFEEIEKWREAQSPSIKAFWDQIKKGESE